MEQYETYESQNLDNGAPVQDTPPISRGAKFVQNYLGFVVMGLFLVTTLILLLGFSLGVGDIPYQLLLHQFWPMGIIAAGVVVATRMKGPDMSMGTMMMLSSVIIAWTANLGSISAGILSAILVCLLYGMFNGAIISFLGAPTIVITIVTAAMMRAVAFIFTGGLSTILVSEIGTAQQAPFFIMFVLAVAIAFVALAITKRLPTCKGGQKKGAFPKLMDMLGYALVAIIAGIAGFAFLRRLGAASLTIGSGFETNIILIFAAIQSSKLLKNNVIALGYGLVVVLILTTYRIAAIGFGMSPFWLNAVEAGLAFQLICAACIAQGGWRSVLHTNLEPIEEKI